MWWPAGTCPPAWPWRAAALPARTEVPAGYNAAARDIRKGEPILKYNTCIGFAAEDTPPAP